MCLAFILSHGPLLAVERYAVPCRADLVRAALDTAIAQEGTIEATGRNDGAVKKYWRWLLNSPVPYCYLGRVWSFKQAAQALQLPSSEIPIPTHTGLARHGWNDARKRGKATPVTPVASDFIYWGFPKNSNGHVGQVVKVYAGGWLSVNEFNTSGNKNSNQRDGDGVHRKRRNWLHPLGRMRVLGFVGFSSK